MIVSVRMTYKRLAVLGRNDIAFCSITADDFGVCQPLDTAFGSAAFFITAPVRNDLEVIPLRLVYGIRVGSGLVFVRIILYARKRQKGYCRQGK